MVYTIRVYYNLLTKTKLTPLKMQITCDFISIHAINFFICVFLSEETPLVIHLPKKILLTCKIIQISPGHQLTTFGEHCFKEVYWVVPFFVRIPPLWKTLEFQAKLLEKGPGIPWKKCTKSNVFHRHFHGKKI